MNTLFEITNELARLNDLLESGAIDEQAFADTLEASIRQDAENKLEACAWAIRKLRAESENLKDEAKFLKTKADRKEANAERILASVHRYMETAKIREAKAGSLDFKIVKNPPSVQCDPDIELELPDRFITRKTVITPNKEAIKEAIKAGGTIPGCSLVSKERVDIK